MTRISNLNSVLVRNYGSNFEILALLKQLDKMGLMKTKSKSKPKPTLMDEIKQDSDMVSSVTYSEPNLFALRQIEPGMTQQQIEDTQERNAAGVAALRAEVQQQRLEDIKKQERLIGGLAGATAQRFGQLQSGLGDISSQRFGTSYEPIIEESSFEPDIEEGGERFSQTLNEGGPKATTEVPTELFAEGEEQGARIQPQERLQIGYGMSPAAAETLGLSPEFIEKTKQATKKNELIPDAQDTADKLGLGRIPRTNDKKERIVKYYQDLIDRLSLRADRDVMNKGTRVDYIGEINSILKDFGKK